MPKKLSQIDDDSSAEDAATALRNCKDERLVVKGSGGGHSDIGWAVMIDEDDGEDDKKGKKKGDKDDKDAKKGKQEKKSKRKKMVASGSIPMSSHGAKNLPRALKELVDARDEYDLTD